MSRPEYAAPLLANRGNRGGHASRYARLAAPSASSALLRLSQLLVLVAAGADSNHTRATGLIAGIGVIGAVTVMTDSGAANYVLSHGESALNRITMRRVLQVHLALASIGTCAAVAFCEGRFAALRPGDCLFIVTSVALTQGLESLVRVARTPLLVRSQDHRLAGLDVLLAVSKVPVTVAGLLSHDARWLTGLPVGSILILAFVLARLPRMLNDEARHRPSLRSILQFGANGAASTLYSQSPLLAAGVLMPVSTVAAITLCYRVAQPLELIPATMSQQLLPRLRRQRVSRNTAWLGLGAVGAVFAVATIAAHPLVERLFHSHLDWPLYLLIMSSLPIKFGNYGLTAYTFAIGQAARKLKITLAVGLCIVGIAFLAAAAGSTVAIAATTCLAELLLTGALLTIHPQARLAP